MKKALIVANLIGFVGFLWNDIKILQDLGYEVFFAANSEMIANEEHIEELRKKNIKFIHLSFSSKKPLEIKNLKEYGRLKSILKQEKFDLIHCHTPIVGFFSRFAAMPYRKKGTKVIYTTHGLTFTHLSTKSKWIVYYCFEKLASYFTDVIITINNEDYNNAKKFACKDVRLINGVGVDTLKYHSVEIDKESYKKALGLPNDKIMILSVGELSERKNHQVIIKALSHISNKEDFIYVICGREVGSSKVTENLKRLAVDMGVDLYLLGHRSDIPEIMHCSDIGAIPSVREGLGLAGIQSLCAEVPLVGTRVQGIQDYIIDDVSGYLCEPYDEVGFSKAILKIAKSDNRSRLAKNCYTIAQRYDIKISNEQMRKIYSSVLI